MDGNPSYSRQKRERAVLVGVWNREISEELATEHLEELSLLVKTAGGDTIKTFMQRVDRVTPATFVRSGKLEEIKEFIDMEDIDLVVFDDDLSASQVRNIDKVLGVKVMDRAGIILHIFSVHARTAQAKAQVELAHLQYLLPRLTGLWTHLSKQKGGIGMKGAGEKEIETDRRAIHVKIDTLKKKLIKIEKQNQTSRKQRDQLVRVSLVGYTNAGKSTLMNRLSKANILAEDKLFATLDTTVRKVVLKGTPFLLSDTVGFIRKLPHNLIECFKGTLEESRESDILMLVVDISQKGYEDRMKVVYDTLDELEAKDKRIIVVFNKIDNLKPEEQEELRDSWIKKANSPCVFVSAEKNINIGPLRDLLVDEIMKMYHERYPNLKHLYESNGLPDLTEYNPEDYGIVTQKPEENEDVIEQND